MSDPIRSTMPLQAGPAMTRLTTAMGERIIAARLATGLTATQLQVLRLASDDGATMTALATSLGLSKSTLTSVVDQLVTSKLVERANDPADRRRQVVQLTGPGRSALSDFDAEVARQAAAIIGGLPDERRTRLAELLRVIADPTRPIPLA